MTLTCKPLHSRCWENDWEGYAQELPELLSIAQEAKEYPLTRHNERLHDCHECRYKLMLHYLKDTDVDYRYAIQDDERTVGFIASTGYHPWWEEGPDIACAFVRPAYREHPDLATVIEEARQDSNDY